MGRIFDARAVNFASALCPALHNGRCTRAGPGRTWNPFQMRCSSSWATLHRRASRTEAVVLLLLAGLCLLEPRVRAAALQARVPRRQHSLYCPGTVLHDTSPLRYFLTGPDQRHAARPRPRRALPRQAAALLGSLPLLARPPGEAWLHLHV